MLLNWVKLTDLVTVLHSEKHDIQYVTVTVLSVTWELKQWSDADLENVFAESTFAGGHISHVSCQHCRCQLHGDRRCLSLQCVTHIVVGTLSTGTLSTFQWIFF